MVFFATNIYHFPNAVRDDLVRETGSQTNTRVCEDSFKVVYISPHPSYNMNWAPEDICKTEGL